MSDAQQPGEFAVADENGLTVPSAPRSVALVRRYAVDACTAYGWGESADTVALLVSELATNAVLHAYGPEVHVRVMDEGLRLRVEVIDGSPVPPVPRGAASEAETGRGFAVVEALAIEWGVDVRPGGKTTWFEVGA